MNRKKVLFVIHSVWAGGTNSALCSLYNNIDKTRYEVFVWAIDCFGERVVDYKPAMVKKEWLVAAYYGSGHFSNVFERISYLCVKLYKKVAKYVFHISDECFNSHSVMRFEKNHHFDTVVAYSEHVVRFCSHFRCENKIAWVHCDYERGYHSEVSEELYYKQYNRIVTVSKATTDIIKRFYPSLESRCMTIYNLVDVDKIRNKSTEFIDDSRFNEDGFVIISVGRVAEVKRFRMIPRIAKELKDEGLIFKWYIVGPAYDMTEVEAIKNAVNECGVSDCVISLGGKPNPYPYFKKADLYVSTSLVEACPMVFIEAQLLGIPIVTTDFPAAYEFIRTGETGFISHIGNISSFIKKCMVEKDLYDRLCDNVSDFVCDNDAILNQIYDVL